MAAKVLSGSPNLKRLLTFLVDRKLHDDVESLKESVLGLEVFGKSAEYDPKIDPIVRVYAHRLRRRLDEYYRQDGANAPVRILLPAGSYVPMFEVRDVFETRDDAAPAPEPARPNRRWPHWATAAAACVIILGTSLYLLNVRTRRAPADRVYDSIAVLPFADMIGDPDLRYFTDGLAEELITTLSHAPGLKVIARTSTFAFRGRETDIRAIGRELNVSSVLEGSVRRNGSGVRITAQLIETIDGTHLWSGVFDREIKDTVLVQEDISHAILASLKAGPLVATLTNTGSSRHVPSANAYQAYLKGRYLWYRVTPDDFRRAISQLEESVALDPNFAPAYSALAESYSGLASFRGLRPRDAWPQSKAMARKAIALDDSFGEAHTILAGVMANYDWDQPGAEAEYKRGLELAPGSSTAHQYYATFLGSRKRWKEANEQMEQAQRLDPLWSLGNWGAAQLLLWQGRLDEAAQIIEKLMVREPAFAQSYQLIAQVRLMQTGAASALDALKRAPAAVQELPLWLGHAGYSLAAAGDTSAARECLAKLERLSKTQIVSPHYAALIHQGLGEKPRAIQLLAQALDERVLRPGWLAVDPMFNPLRSEPAFQALLSKVGL